MFKKFAQDHFGELAVGAILGVVISIIVALILIPLVTDSVTTAKNETTGTADTLLDMVPLFFVLGIALLAVIWVVKQAKGVG